MADKKTKGVWSLYKVEGSNVNRESRFCPKCGEGFFMAKHADRFQCGKCNYVEYVRKEEKPEKKEEKAKE